MHDETVEAISEGVVFYRVEDWIHAYVEKYKHHLRGHIRGHVGFNYYLGRVHESNIHYIIFIIE